MEHVPLTATDIYALAIALVTLGGALTGGLLSAFRPYIKATVWTRNFLVAAIIFRSTYATYESIKLQGHIVWRYFAFDWIVLLLAYTLVMGAVLWAIETRRALGRARDRLKESADSLDRTIKRIDTYKADGDYVD